MNPLLGGIFCAGFAIILYFAFIQLPKKANVASRQSPACLLFLTWVIACAVWGPYFHVTHLQGFFDFSIDRMVFIFVVFIFIAAVYGGSIQLSRSVWVEIFMVIFILLCMVSMVRHGFRSSIPNYPSPWNIFINGYLFSFLAFVLAKHFFREEGDRVLLFHVFFFFGTYLVATAYMEFFEIDYLVFPGYITDPDIFLHWDRARGPFLNAAFNGVAIVIGFICGVHLLSRAQGVGRLVYLFLLFLYLPGIFFTQTRSVYLAFLVALFLIYCFYRTEFPKWKVFAVPIVLICLVALANAPRFLSQDRRAGGMMQTDEIAQRVGLLKRTAVMFWDYPILGVGLARFTPVSRQDYQQLFQFAASSEDIVQHNHLMGLLAEMGVVGVMVYLGIVGGIFSRLFYLIKNDIPSVFFNRNAGVLVMVIWVVYLINNCFVEPAFCLFVNVAVFSFAGMCDGLYLQRSNDV